MKRAIIAAAVIVLLAGIGVGGWFGAMALTEDDNGYTQSAPARLPQPTPPPIPTSCNEVVLCKSWELTLFGSKESRSSFELMARACGLPTDLGAPQYILICRR